MAAVTADTLTIETLSPESVRRLLDPPPEPCLSLYVPTHRNVPDSTVDPHAFGHLVDALAAALAPRRDAAESLLRPFRVLAADAAFWRHTRDGLAVLAAAGSARVFLLQRPVPPLALVGPRFHTLPLVRLAAAIDRFHVLALNSREARVYEGTIWQDASGAEAGRLDPVPLAAQPGPAAEFVARSDVVDEETLQPHRVQRGMGPAGLGAIGVVHGGTGSRRDDFDADTEIFLRHVDDVVHEQISRRAALPLVLVALPRQAAAFRRLSKNPLLIEGHVPSDPHLMTADDLADAVKPIFVAARRRRIDRAVHAFRQARDQGLAAGDLADVSRAAVTGRVATLLVECDRFETGHLDRETGAIEFDGAVQADLSRSGGRAPWAEDLFGAVAETVLLHGGGVLPLERNAMPTESGVAAIYRY